MPIFSIASRTGSSPLARGTPQRHRHQPESDRFIPARAGNTSATSGRLAHAPVHPRSRGEHGIPASAIDGPAGSSPLARGTRHPDLPAVSGSRFIPARAGNTICTASTHTLRSVHPRSRGEHIGDSGTERNATGFIPARAGNTPPRELSGGARPVHPRSRGEHDSDMIVAPPRNGSSPLARGTRVGSLTPHWY